jgi:hypothetical protein
MMMMMGVFEMVEDSIMVRDLVEKKSEKGGKIR